MKEVEQYKHTKEIYLNVFVFYLFGNSLIRRIYFCLYIYIYPPFHLFRILDIRFVYIVNHYQ